MAATALPSNPAERLAVLIEGLCKAVAAHGVRGWLTAPLLLLLWPRLSRMARRARCLATRMAAGVPLAAPTRPRAAPRTAPSGPYIRLPRGVTWLVRVVPGTAAGAATLRYLLDDPDMVAAAQAPPMRRLLRPLCRMLGVDPPPIKPPAPPPEASPPIASDPPPEPPVVGSNPLPDPPAPKAPALPKNAA